jgi:DNA-directed RNA polymerase specialized sigma24 family protein
MNLRDPSPVTVLLLRWGAGEEDCLNELVPLVEHELRRIAHCLMRKERQGHTPQTTALVNEAYLKLVTSRAPIGRTAALIALDDALQDLAKMDPRKAQVVELRYFGGLNVDEAAKALHVHPNTVIRDWDLARKWLKRELAGGSSAHAG